MKYYVADAFTSELFKGNPAGVCILQEELSEETMQKIAFENNLAETAFLAEKDGTYFLRWFTPETEIDLCGHATLATAFIVMNYINTEIDCISFQTKSGELTVQRNADVFTMDFPSRKPVETSIDTKAFEEALGCEILGSYLSRDLLLLVKDEKTVLGLKPDIHKLSLISKDIGFAVIVTAKGDKCDFVSRFFAPNAGISEDPVTGSSHSTLIPFWSERLCKEKMTAKQLSPRGGTLFCENHAQRVKIGGKAVCYLKGNLEI